MGHAAVKTPSKQSNRLKITTGELFFLSHKPVKSVINMGVTPVMSVPKPPQTNCKAYVYIPRKIPRFNSPYTARLFQYFLFGSAQPKSRWAIANIIIEAASNLHTANTQGCKYYRPNLVMVLPEPQKIANNIPALTDTHEFLIAVCMVLAKFFCFVINKVQKAHITKNKITGYQWSCNEGDKM